VTTFLVVALKTQSKTTKQNHTPTSKSPPPAKKCPKIDYCSTWGFTWCLGGALTNFSP